MNDIIKKPLVSIIIPFYNSEKYIKEAIESILVQTFEDFELILVNDFSKDNSLSVVKKYESIDSRIQIINNANLKGIAGATNTGISVAKGKYIALMDSDDIAATSRIAKQVLFLNSHPRTGVVGTWMEEFENGKNIWKLPISNRILRVTCLIHPPIANPTAMFRKSLLCKYNIKYDETYSSVQDYDFWLKLYKHTKFANIPIVLHYYRVRNSSVSNDNSYNEFNNHRKALSDFLTEWNSQLTESDYKTLYEMKYPSFSFQYKRQNKKIDNLISKIKLLNNEFKIFNKNDLDLFFKEKKRVWLL